MEQSKSRHKPHWEAVLIFSPEWCIIDREMQAIACAEEDGWIIDWLMGTDYSFKKNLTKFYLKKILKYVILLHHQHYAVLSIGLQHKLKKTHQNLSL